MEYMALAKPMVQFDLHEGRVSAGDSSLYAIRNDATSLASCIVALIDDPDARARMGQIGQQRLVTTLSWDFQVPELLAAYKRAADKRPRIGESSRHRPGRRMPGPRKRSQL
jgi:hypothetical protein